MIRRSLSGDGRTKKMVAIKLNHLPSVYRKWVNRRQWTATELRLPDGFKKVGDEYFECRLTVLGVLIVIGFGQLFI